MEYSIWFKVIGPMIFRTPGEFTPFIKGPQIASSSFPLPVPSTIVGSLCSILLSKGAQRGEAEEWYEELIKTLNLTEEDYFRGPYLICRGLHEELYVSYFDGLISIETLYATLESFSSELLSKEGFLTEVKPGKTVKDVIEERFKEASKEVYSSLDRLGIRIQDQEKVAEEPYIYTVREADYSKLMIKGEVYVAIDSSKNFDECIGARIGLGGERRIVQVVNGRPLLMKRVERELREWKEAINGACLYVASHGLYLTEGFRNKASEIIPSIDFITDIISSKLNVKVRGFIGEISVLGGGVSLKRTEKEAVRKPMYASIKPGSMILIENSEYESLIRAFKLGISQVASNLGFGTVIPVPLVKGRELRSQKGL